MTFVTGAGMAETNEQDPIIGESERRAVIRQVQVTWNSLGGVYFRFQGFQIGDRYRTALDLEHSFCL